MLLSCTYAREVSDQTLLSCTYAREVSDLMLLVVTYAREIRFAESLVITISPKEYASKGITYAGNPVSRDPR